MRKYERRDPVNKSAVVVACYVVIALRIQSVGELGVQGLARVGLRARRSERL